MVQKSFNAELSVPVVSGAFIATRETHKFGGSSLADVGCFLRVANIISEHCGADDLFVVSAAGKTTNRLIRFADHCGHDPFIARVELATLFEYQLELINGLLTGESQKRHAKLLRAEFTQLRSQADAVLNATGRASVLGHGELWSARLLAALLNQFGMLSEWLDSRDILCAEVGAQPEIDQPKSRPLVQHAIQSLPGQRIVITGYMASDQDGKTVLLGRNGSDYSATMIGILAGSPCITIWKDVAGVYTADPRKVADAQLLTSVSMAEANELANLCAPVLHRRALQPVIEHNIRVAVRSSYDPTDGTTSIDQTISTIGPKIVTSLDSIAVLSVSSPSGESCERFVRFAEAALSESQVQPISVSVMNTHGTVQFLFSDELVADAVACLESAGFTCHVAEEHHAMVAVVGAGVAHSPVDREKFLNAVQSVCSPPVLVVSSDLSLAVVLKTTDISGVLNKVHAVCVGKN